MLESQVSVTVLCCAWYWN